VLGRRRRRPCAACGHFEGAQISLPVLGAVLNRDRSVLPALGCTVAWCSD